MSQPPSGADSFEEFYEATATSIRAYILRHCGDRSAVDDLFQITYIKFLGSRMAATPLAPQARGYLYRIASNAVADHGRTLQRQQKLRLSIRNRPTSGSEPPLPEGIALREALRTLSKREQQLLWFLYAEGFAHKEVARIMKLSPASVRVLAFRARKKLAQRLAAKNETKEGARS